MNLQRINQFKPWLEGKMVPMYLSKAEASFVNNEHHYRVLRKQAAKIANKAIRKMMRG